ncbi:FadR/GntR family transcriptional regulator [Alkalihalobacillus sp. BA299]|uniref:FadR/GntR family transcriptional regulator n=1 Tax=Alkalihalobacillus sp. BA299 TaxID=2815938 RepID=UPI001ADB90F6|nr:FadR/GntR family transcriptional regulator [Alkalihalobacillus sp. BA299]
MANDQPKVYIEIIKQLNQMIRNNQLKSGDRLPSERELSERLQVGRSSVREAFRALELLELIETRRGEGTYIKKAGSHRLVEIILSFILNDESARQDLAETRKIVEVEALRLACQRITKDQLERLKALIEKSKSEWMHGDFPVEEDYLFHKTIVEACHNGLMLNLWIPLVEYNKVSIRESLSREGRPLASIAEHEEIYNALLKKNEQEAVNALEKHLKNSRF